jgi:hypothetical protein
MFRHHGEEYLSLEPPAFLRLHVPAVADLSNSELKQALAALAGSLHGGAEMSFVGLGQKEPDQQLVVEGGIMLDYLLQGLGISAQCSSYPVAGVRSRAVNAEVFEPSCSVNGLLDEAVDAVRLAEILAREVGQASLDLDW